jgi:arylsulfatase
MMIPLMGAAGEYIKDLMKYPPQFKIGFLSNNPPMYNLAPKADKMIKKELERFNREGFGEFPHAQ